MAFPFTDSGALISCGGPGDSWAIGGQAADRGPIEIGGAPGREELYRTERWGMSGYSIPLASGIYDVRMHFAETWFTTAGRRPMDITVAGVKVPTFDVFTEAGGGRKALVKSVTVTVTDNSLDITWASPATAMINAIEVTKPGVLRRDMPVAPPVDEPAPPPPPSPPPPPTLPAEPTTGIQPPAHAKAQGLTKLAFAEDFDDPSRINIAGNALGRGQTMCQIGDGNPAFGASLNPQSAFKFGGGVVTIDPASANYHAQLTSVAGKRAGWAGYELRGTGWCVEIRWKHRQDTPGSGFPAFWSMDSRHWFLNGLARGDRYLEPDFSEWINGAHIGAIHLHTEGGKEGHDLSMIHSGSAVPCDPTKFYVASAMAHPKGADYSWWVNGVRQMRGLQARINAPRPSPVSKVPDFLLGYLDDFRGPILVGTGPSCPIDIDWIRVWTAP